MRNFLIALLLAGCLLFSGAEVSANQREFVFCTINKPESRLYKISQRVLAEAFGRLDFKVDLRECPANRAPIEIDKGRIDGDSHRIYDFNKAK